MDLEIPVTSLTKRSKTIPPRNDLVEEIREVVRLEADTLLQVAEQIDESFAKAVKLLQASKGKVILTGVGKSGLIARKIAATLNSTGTTATFLHSSDGMHGDLGILNADDVVVAIGKSGESQELIELLPALRRLGAKIIAITANRESTLAAHSDIVLYTPIAKEACPLDLAPTTSTTAALAVGDALAITLMKLKGFKQEDFAKYHPGGKLGKRLLLRVADILVPLAKCSVLNTSAKMEDVISGLSQCGLGIVLFTESRKLVGILTDGDIRRLLSKYRSQLFEIDLTKVINRTPVTIESSLLAVEALRKMEEHRPQLNVVPIVDDGSIQGVARLHDLLSVS